jgi:transglutaminase-like putative cysteine protease
VLVALVLAAAVAAGRERPPAHPSDDTEVFTGGEESTPGRAPRRPALAYWKVRATFDVGATTGPVRLGLLVPLSDARQDVLARRTVASGFRFREEVSGSNLRAQWTGRGSAGTRISYEVAVRVAETTAVVPTIPLAALRPPPEGAGALAPSRFVQSASPAVVRRARRVIGTASRLDEATWALYQYVAAFLPATDPPGPQDAASVLAARRGTSLGRARALVALLRAAGVPAELVGGLRLTDEGERRATNSWVEAWTGREWIPLDPAGGFFATLPTTYLTLYRGDLPLIVHTRGLPLQYGFTVRRASRRAVEEGEEEPVVTLGGGTRPALRGPAPGGVQTHTAHVAAPVASVVLIADQSVPAAVTERILSEAREAAIDCVLLTAHFESRYFREAYLERLITANLALIREADLLLVATADDAGLYALMGLGERGVRLEDSRIVVAGAMSRPAALMLGSVLARLVTPGEIALVRRPADLLPLWEVARANLIDGTPMAEEARRWDIDALVLGDGEAARVARWRRPLVRAWAGVVQAQVPLAALTLILILPIIASLVVVARVVIGVETFGMFGPVIVALAFVTTGLAWGTLIFVAVVGLGVGLRMALQRLRLQAVARLAILITLVAAVMGGLTLVGARLGIGPLLNISIFPMIIMSNVIENFAASQVEFGTRQAVRMTVTTLLLAIACYLVVDRAGLQSLVLAFPEILLATIVFDVLLGKWRGLRLLEYVRFLGAVPRATHRPRKTVAAAAQPLDSHRP